jgi:hypothetical protein
MSILLWCHARLNRECFAPARLVVAPCQFMTESGEALVLDAPFVLRSVVQ